MKKSRLIPIFVLAAPLLTGCSLEAKADPNSLMTAINYDSDDTRITFQSDVPYETPNGRKLSKGDYKPVHAAVQKRLGITLLEHQGSSVSGNKKSADYFKNNWMINQYADIARGTVVDINNYSVAGAHETILDLKPIIKETTFNDNGSFKEKGRLPNIAKFLHENPGVEMSIVTAKHSKPDKGAIYYVPYFDGFKDLEKMTMVREDYIKILFGEHEKITPTFNGGNDVIGTKEEQAAKKCKYVSSYQPYNCVDNNKTPSYKIDVPNVDEKGVLLGTTNFEKKETENIIYTQNQRIEKNEDTCENLVNDFKTYIDNRYGKPGDEGSLFKKYSDLFLDYKACYDADEMVALMRIIKTSAKTLNLYTINENGDKTDTPKEMIPFMPRQLDNQRTADIYRWGGQLFGMRGYESRNSYLYMNGKTNYGEGFTEFDKFHDCRGDEDTVKLLHILNNIYNEGLILQKFTDKTATGEAEGKFATQTIEGNGNDHYAGFMVYDYVQPLGELNKQTEIKKLNTEGSSALDKKRYNHLYNENMNFRPIVGGVANWDTTGNGERDTYMQFTESWQSVKTNAICLKASLVNEPQKLENALKYIDYTYSDEGTYLYNFGPYEDGYVDDRFFKEDGTAKTNEELEQQYGKLPEEERPYKEFQAKKIPVFTKKALEQFNDATFNGWQRHFVGATLPFGYIKLKGMDYQLTHENAQKGIDIVNKCLEAGTFRHVLTGASTEEEKELYQKGFYKIVPSAFFLTKGQSSAITSLSDKNKLGMVFNNSSSSDFSIWDYYVMGTDPREPAPKFSELDTKYVTKFNKDWQLPKYVSYYQDAYELMA